MKPGDRVLDSCGLTGVVIGFRDVRGFDARMTTVPQWVLVEYSKNERRYRDARALTVLS